MPTGGAQCELGGVQSRSALPAGHPQDSLGMDLSSRRHPAPILAHGPPLPSAKSPRLASLARARALPASSARILPALPVGGPGLRQLPALTLVLPEPPRRASSPQCTSCLPHMWGHPGVFPRLLWPTVSLLCAQGRGRPSHCPLLSDPPQNGPWCCRHGRLWARAPRGHWMSPPLQDPATYDRRPSAPARRGTGRLCLPHQPRSGWASAHTPRPPLGTSAPIWPLAMPLLMPCEGRSLCPDPAASSPYPQPPVLLAVPHLLLPLGPASHGHWSQAHVSLKPNFCFM